MFINFCCVGMKCNTDFHVLCQLKQKSYVVTFMLCLGDVKFLNKKVLQTNITMETQSSKRCSNFSKEEEHLLVSLVSKYKDIIESKETNAVTWKKKNEKWMQIEKEFNANSGLNGCRSMKMLKEKYLNLKKKTKKNFTK